MYILSILPRVGMDLLLTKLSSQSLLKSSDFFEDNEYLHGTATVFFLSSILGILLFLLSHYVALFFGSVELEPQLKIAAIGIPLINLIQINASVLRGFKMDRWYLFFQNSGRFGFAILIFTLLMIFNTKQTNPIAAMVFAFGMLTFLSFCLLPFKLNISKIRYLNVFNVKRIVTQGLPFMVTSSVLLSIGWTDKIVLGIFRPESEVGVYEVIYKIAAVLGFLLTVINAFISPSVVQYYERGEIKSLQKLLSKYARINIVFTLILFLILFLSIKKILLLFGEEYLIGVSAFYILIFGQLVNSLSGSVGLIMQMTGYHKEFRNIISIGFLLNLVLSFLLVGEYGLQGVALASSISFLFWNIKSIFFLKKNIGIVPF